MPVRVLFIAGLSAVLWLAACRDAAPEGSSSTTLPGPEPEKSGPAAPPRSLSVDLRAVLVNDPGEDGFPRHEVRLVLNGAEHVVDTVAVCPLLDGGERSEHQMPAEALAACGGWYAGGGDYFYVLQRHDSLLVFQGWLDEMQQDDSYHYELVWATRL